MTDTLARSDVRVRHARLELKPATRSTVGGGLRVAGTAVVYDSPSPPGNLPWRETIAPGAFRDVLADPRTDLLLLFGHDRNRPLARQSAGNLKVRDTDRGLEFEAELVNTSDGRDVHELLRSGVVKGCSFAFFTDAKGEHWEFRDGEEWCTIERVARLTELTLTAQPVYEETDAEARSIAEAIRRERIAVRDRTPYGPGSDFSWFADLALVNEATSNLERAVREGHTRIPLGSEMALDSWASLATSTRRGWGGVQGALDRMRQVPQTRDIGTSALSGAVDMGGVPAFIAATFATAARGRALISEALPQDDLPPGFVVPLSTFAVSTTITTGAGTGVQATENSAVTSVDPDASEVELKPATIAGKFTISRQLLERGTDADTLLARELGASLGASLEAQVVQGSGSSGQLTGLLNVSGAVSVAYTDASPTQAELWPFVMQTRGQVAQSGEVPTLLACDPGRRSWLLAALDTANANAQLDPPLRVVESVAGIPINLGGGTNEDRILVIVPELFTLFTRPTSIQLLPDTSGAPQSVTFTAWKYACLVAKRAKAVGVISGTGLILPAGYR